MMDTLHYVQHLLVDNLPDVVVQTVPHVITLWRQTHAYLKHRENKKQHRTKKLDIGETCVLTYHSEVLVQHTVKQIN